MKLVGYIKTPVLNSFTFPIYSDKKGSYYYHKLDKNFNIFAFERTIPNEGNLVKIVDQDYFGIDSKGAIVFVCNDQKVIYGEATLKLNEIMNYLSQDEMKGYSHTLKEASNLHDLIFRHSNRTVKKLFGTSGLESAMIIYIGEAQTNVLFFKNHQIDRKKTINQGTNYIIKELQNHLTINKKIATDLFGAHQHSRWRGVMFSENSSIKLLEIEQPKQRRATPKHSKNHILIYNIISASDIISIAISDIIRPIIDGIIERNETYQNGLLLTGRSNEIRQSSRLISAFSSHKMTFNVTQPSNPSQLTISGIITSPTRIGQSVQPSIQSIKILKRRRRSAQKSKRVTLNASARKSAR